MHKHAKRCLSKTSCPILITSWSREKRYQLSPCIHVPVPEQGSLGMRLHTDPLATLCWSVYSSFCGFNLTCMFLSHTNESVKG